MKKDNYHIGIDKSVLYGFEIKVLDETLLKGENVEYRKNPDYPMKTKNGIAIEKLSIKDVFFGELLCCISKNKPIMKITISASSKNNFFNLSASQYKERIKEVFNYLYNTYKIEINYNFNSLYISYIEINTTFELKYLFKDYCGALFIIMGTIPTESFKKNTPECKVGDKIISIYSNKDESLELETIYIENSSRSLIIYNKTKQLKDKNKGFLKDDYMRIEYKFKRKDSYINKHLKNTVGRLTDENINKLFLDLFDDDIVTPINKLRENIMKNITAYLRDVHKNNGNKFPRDWRDTLLSKIVLNEKENKNPMIIDYTDIEKAISEVKLFRHKKKSNW